MLWWRLIPPPPLKNKLNKKKQVKMEELIILGKVLGSSFFITKFSPIQWILDLIQPTEKTNAFLVLVYNIISLAISCFSCCSFWLGFLFFNFWYGVTTYVIAYFYIQLLSPIVEKIRLL